MKAIRPDCAANVRVFLNQDALSLVLDMPSGEQKEALAKPASVLQPCVKLVSYKDEVDKYYFLFIIPDTRDTRILVVSKTLTDIAVFMSDERFVQLNDEMRETVFNQINHYH